MQHQKLRSAIDLGGLSRRDQIHLVEPIFLRVIQFCFEIGERHLRGEKGTPCRVETRLDRFETSHRRRRQGRRTMRLEIVGGLGEGLLDVGERRALRMGRLHRVVDQRDGAIDSGVRVVAGRADGGGHPAR